MIAIENGNREAPPDYNEGKLNPHLITAFNQKMYSLKSANILFESTCQIQKTNPFLKQ